MQLLLKILSKICNYYSEILLKICNYYSKILLKICIYFLGFGNSSEIASNNVFKKSFTGSNGREMVKSTGMGLYICKKLCMKLGHKIEIESEEGKYTMVRIVFGKNGLYHPE